MLEKSQMTNIAVKHDFSYPGDYLIAASIGSESTQRLVKIVDWQNIDLENNQKYQIININPTYNICGSLIQENISTL
jgi:hypothetical protein